MLCRIDAATKKLNLLLHFIFIFVWRSNCYFNFRIRETLRLSKSQVNYSIFSFYSNYVVAMLGGNITYTKCARVTCCHDNTLQPTIPVIYPGIHVIQRSDNRGGYYNVLYSLA